MSPKAHISFTPQEINTNQNIQQNQTKQRQQKWCEGQKETNSNKVEHAQRVKAPHTCTQPIMGGKPWVKVFKGCGLVVGRKRRSILEFLLKLLRKRYPVVMASHPKEVNVGWDHLMHAIEIDDEEA